MLFGRDAHRRWSLLRATEESRDERRRVEILSVRPGLDVEASGYAWKASPALTGDYAGEAKRVIRALQRALAPAK